MSFNLEISRQKNPLQVSLLIQNSNDVKVNLHPWNNMDRVIERIEAETRSLNQPAALLSNDPANSCNELAAGDHDSPLESRKHKVTSCWKN